MNMQRGDMNMLYNSLNVFTHVTIRKCRLSPIFLVCAFGSHYEKNVNVNADSQAQTSAVRSVTLLFAAALLIYIRISKLHTSFESLTF